MSSLPSYSSRTGRTTATNNSTTTTASKGSSTACTLIVVGILLVAANVVLSLYSVPTFTLPARLKGPDATTNNNNKDSTKVSESDSASCTGRNRLKGQHEGEGEEEVEAEEDGGSSSSTPRGARKTTASTKQKPSFVTHESCYAQPDEAETCFYSGPFCFDGERVVVTYKSATQEKRGNDPRTSMCYDFRHFVPSQSCGYNGPHRRDDLPPNQPIEELQDHAPRVMSVSADSHTWGPLGREVAYREVSDEYFKILVEQSQEGSMNNGESGFLADDGTNITLHWLDGPLYAVGLHHSWIDHVWHFAAATMALYDIKRHNLSSVLEAVESNTVVTAGSWEAPHMKNLVFVGGYRPVSGFNNLVPWISNLLKMLIQSDTKVWWNTDWEAINVAPTQTWMCSKHGGSVIGLKPRMFNSLGDAQAFRLLAYNFAKLKGIKAKDEWPPRQITLITRLGSRSIVNEDEVVPILNNTGLKFVWIQEMGKLTWQQQVQTMAETGILLGVHGAGLANIIYMPAHSVLIEIFPYIMYASMYRDAATTAGMFYYRIQSVRPPNDTASGQLIHDQIFTDTCDGEIKHISSPAAFLDYECNWRSKSSPIVIDPVTLQNTISMALDDIGCRDGYCEFTPGKPSWEHTDLIGKDRRRELAMEKEVKARNKGRGGK